LRVLVTGAGGMVGSALVTHCRSVGDEVFAYDHQSLDIADHDAVSTVLQFDRPDAVINCAAYTDVDGSESAPEKARAANALGPENLATASRLINAKFITVSTDYVFDGFKDGFYSELDEPNPQSVYGHSKLEGELLSQNANPRTSVVRAAMIFGRGGKNFLSRIVERADRGEPMKAIKDAFGTPTYAVHLASRLRELAQIDASGVFHVVNSGPGVSFEEFTRLALDLAGYEATKIESVSMATLKRPAARPSNSRLRSVRLDEIGLPELPPLERAIREFVAKRGV